MQDVHAFLDAGLTTFERALKERGSEFRNVQIATLSPEGRPGLRTMVMRGFTRSPATAETHSDARASKIRDITQAGHVALLAWSAADRLQLRFEGFARLHQGDALARQRWDALSENARKPYGLRAHPGRPVDDPGNQDHLPPAEQFEHFTVIVIALATLDMLRLEEDGGQTRAHARLTDTGLDPVWIGP